MKSVILIISIIRAGLIMVLILEEYRCETIEQAKTLFTDIKAHANNRGIGLAKVSKVVPMKTMVEKLRDEQRIKLGVDYTYTYKYGELHILCHAVYRETIEKYAADHNLPITTIHTYGG